jgi:U3 small nucleolar RNA-associated protein 23
MEPMAERSAEVREAEEKGKVRAGLKSRRGAEVVSGEKRKAEGAEGEEGEDTAVAAAPKRKKPKGPSGPNPLSVKKPKKEKTGEEKKSVGRKVEDERSVLRKAEKQDPQVGEKAISAEDVVMGEGEGAAPTDGSKRKRKRKPKDAAPSHPGNDDAIVRAAVSKAIAEAGREDRD